jgi:hypothetical protein
MKRLVLCTVLLLAGVAGQLSATATYVGSWTVDQGPYWSPPPTAYSGQQAAAFLFGGSPSSYEISTVSSNPTQINFSAWISTFGGGSYCTGFPCGAVVAQNYVVSTGGLYENFGDTSAYVLDWAQGAQYTNYAFVVPEPGSLVLFGSGALGLIGLLRRKLML